MMLTRPPIALYSLLLLSPALFAGQAATRPVVSPRDRPFPLMLGDPAPPLRVARWIQGRPLGGYQRGHIYVVDFWASWCVPCVASLPTLNRLALEYGDRVTFVWMNVWEPRPGEVDHFLAQLREKPGFRVGLDRVTVPRGGDIAVAMYEGGTATGWLKASGKDTGGLPVTFVIGQDGRLAWIGGPEELPGPLAKIVSGTWDLKAEVAAYTGEMTIAARSAPLQRELLSSMQAHDWRRTVEVSDRLLALDREKFADRAAGKFEILLRQLDSPREAYEWGYKVLEEETSPRVLNRIAWVIVAPENHLASPDLELARRASDRASALAGKDDPAILQTRARVAFVRGDKQAAIRLQTRAIEVAPAGERDAMRKALADYSK